MKKLFILILLISGITIANAKKSNKNDFIMENIPDEIKINKNQNNEEFEKEIIEIPNPSKNGEFKITVTFPDKEMELEYVDYVFMDNDFNFATTEDSYNSLTNLERGRLSSRVFIEPVFEQNGSIEYKVKTSDDKVLIGFIYKVKKNHFINSVSDIIFIDVEK